MPSLKNITKRVVLLLAAGAAVIILTGCGSTEAVCQGARAANVLVVTTQDGFAAVRSMVPQVAHELVQQTAASCGRLIVGIAGDRPESDLVLQSMKFTPRDVKAFNRKPDVTRMIAAGDGFVQKYVLQPLRSVQLTRGGAYLGTLTAIGNQLHADGIDKANVIIVGNAMEREALPSGSGTVDFAQPPSPTGTSAALRSAAAAFAPQLTNLASSCVKFVGAGAGTQLPDSAILADQALLQQTLSTVHVGFAATRSPDVPARCSVPRPRVSIVPTPRLVVATLSADVTFRLGSAQLQPGAANALEQLVPKLTAATSVTVDGYTDSTGTEAINGPLSKARALSVARWLADHSGFPLSRIKVRGFGAADPAASDGTVEGRAANRRVVVEIGER